MKNEFDVIVIGGGPAGCTAALYTVRSGFSTLLVEKLYAGGQMTETSQIDNYPGFPDGIDGFTLGAKMQAGAQRFGVETVNAETLSLCLDGRDKIIETGSGEYRAKAVIIATGAGHRQLGLPMENELTGKGLAYCAACDGMFYRGKTVAVVGGGNSAAADAITLSRIAEKVYLIHRRDTLRATKVYHETLQQAGNIEFVWNSEPVELLHDEFLSGVKLKNNLSGQEHTLKLDGLFISAGRSPLTEPFKTLLELDKDGYIIADETTRTSVPGIFAAGDVRTKSVRQIVTAVADGAASAHFAEKYLLNQE